MKTVVRTSTTDYPVITGKGLLGSFAEVAGEYVTSKKIAVVTDDNVSALWLDKLKSTLPDNTETYTFPHGETSKNWETAGKILEWLAKKGFTRTDVILALGGGVVGDIAGFVASVYMRGIDYVQIPTTLLAAIDSSVGGKTAVDLQAGKNLAGRIYPPRAVVFDSEVLSTLPKSEWTCGLGEAV